MQPLRALFDRLLPPTCVFCGLDANGLCAPCRDDLPWNRVCCPACATPMLHADTLCPGCQRRRPPLVAVVAPLRYAFPVDAALKALKFRARAELIPAVTPILTTASARLPADVDAVVPMPMHWLRRARRGFNQAEELAAPVARQLGLPLLGSVDRVRHTRSQAGLSAAARRRNVAKAFQVRERLAARHPLIVDDVMTTGHSCAQLAHALRQAGAVRVSVLVLARAG